MGRDRIKLLVVPEIKSYEAPSQALVLGYHFNFPVMFRFIDRLFTCFRTGGSHR
jgi:hypothetical protein